ncbi:hypothetical protein, partial [Ottowia sp.]|uniref:hypothetical protein n=1 Tax=Ottowia sp. TaxID=1898956 RepID=UPI0025D7282E
FRQRARHHQLLGSDLARREAVAHQAQRLVVQVALHVAVLAQVLHHVLGAPARPVVLGKADASAWPANVHAFIHVAGLGQRVAHLGARMGHRVMHGMAGVFGHVQPARICGK